MSSFSGEPDRAILERELAPGETLVWHSRPDPARLRQRGWTTFGWACLMAGFMAFWMWHASETLRQNLASG